MPDRSQRMTRPFGSEGSAAAPIGGVLAAVATWYADADYFGSTGKSKRPREFLQGALLELLRSRLPDLALYQNQMLGQFKAIIL
ncbi:hypothetical protein KIN_02660 [Litoreibacter roseus]|uniref:Uncharacterized protein n=1 Tax=Litoreibacter roseus TaxID=2601869 RepID=A0A6N6JDC4_9RHOB|nr:hypothetical protein KIN_02660 [Litoreibacter roseus]